MFAFPPPSDKFEPRKRKRKPRLRLSKPKPKPKARAIDLGLGFPPAVLCDMARCLVRGIDADYFELVPTLDEDCNWLKRTNTHSFLLIGYWWVCTYCDHAEQYCECEGITGSKP